MTLKEFLKPTIWKIVIFLIFMGGLNYLIISKTVILDARILVGVPFGFYPKGSFFCDKVDCAPRPVEFSWNNFIIDIMFWYLISCSLLYFYEKSKKGRKLYED